MTDVLSPDEALSEIVGGEGHGLLTLPGGKSIPFKAHPLADLFPMMSPDEMAALVEDVRERGVQRPIVLLDGMVLDGRNRYHAAREAEVGYHCVDFTGTDPLAFVISENMHRRHLTTSQRAMVAARIANLQVGSNQYVQRVKDPETGEVVGIPTGSKSGLARALNVSRDTVVQAAKVASGGTPELVAAVASGDVSVSAAAEVAKLPEAEQVEIVAQGPEAVKAAAKAARRPKPETVKEPDEPVDPERRKLARMPDEAKIDEIIGLRTENADLRQKLSDTKADRDQLKTRVAELSTGDQGATISALQKQLQAAKLKRDDAMTATKRMEYRLKKAEARVAELEQTPIEMGV